MKLLHLASLSLSVLAAACTNPPAPETGSPNVVYIMSDTHRWGAMSFTQAPAVQTKLRELDPAHLLEMCGIAPDEVR
ncbi:MAG: hypothetical protein BMS9Abin37_1604 [Acidobacteriota bacterium]|nr:MAG: hypothetical protein BMS9Abin37_1604 [Acidobacteriota bacterium]